MTHHCSPFPSTPNSPTFGILLDQTTDLEACRDGVDNQARLVTVPDHADVGSLPLKNLVGPRIGLKRRRHNYGIGTDGLDDAGITSHYQALGRDLLAARLGQDFDPLLGQPR